MVENEFFRLSLENYFEEHFKRLQIGDKKYQCLGTYDNFDEVSSEKILFELLEHYLEALKHSRESAIKIKNKYKQKPQKYDDELYKIKKYKRLKQQNEEMQLLLKGYEKNKSKHLPTLIEV
jgi:hypothetical protein